MWKTSAIEMGMPHNYLLIYNNEHFKARGKAINNRARERRLLWQQPKCKCINSCHGFVEQREGADHFSLLLNST